MTAKQALIEIANSLSDENDWEEAQYLLHLRRKMESSEEDVRQGQTFTTEEARGLKISPKLGLTSSNVAK